MPPVTLEQPQSLPAPAGAPWSGHHGSICDHLSAKAPKRPKGPGLSLMGRSGLVRGAERCRSTLLCSGRAPCGCLPYRGTVLQLPGAADVC